MMIIKNPTDNGGTVQTGQIAAIVRKVKVVRFANAICQQAVMNVLIVICAVRHIIVGCKNSLVECMVQDIMICVMIPQSVTAAPAMVVTTQICAGLANALTIGALVAMSLAAVQ